MTEFNKKIEELKDKSDGLERELQDSGLSSNSQKMQRASKEYSEIRVILDLNGRLEKVAAEIEELNKLAGEEVETELAEMSKLEILRLKAEKEALAGELAEALNPKDPLDKKDIIMEIRAGTGGD